MFPPEFLKRILPGLILVAAVAFDQAGWLAFSVVPVTCVFALAAFSFFMSSRLLIWWTVIYLLLIAVTLWLRRDIWSGSRGNVDALVATRALVAAAAGLLACLLARYRERNLIASREINRLLDQLDIPIITSDQDGWLTHLNPEASRMLGGGIALGTPFFEHFSVVTERGKSIQSYVDLATGVTGGPLPTTLTTGPDRSRVVPAIMMRVDIGERGNVMTLLYPEGGGPLNTPPRDD